MDYCVSENGKSNRSARRKAFNNQLRNWYHVLEVIGFVKKNKKIWISSITTTTTLHPSPPRYIFNCLVWCDFLLRCFCFLSSAFSDLFMYVYWPAYLTKKYFFFFFVKMVHEPLVSQNFQKTIRF